MNKDFFFLLYTEDGDCSISPALKCLTVSLIIPNKIRTILLSAFKTLINFLPLYCRNGSAVGPATSVFHLRDEKFLL